jgi:hypothetical protein
MRLVSGFARDSLFEVLVRATSYGQWCSNIALFEYADRLLYFDHDRDETALPRYDARNAIGANEEAKAQDHYHKSQRPRQKK